MSPDLKRLCRSAGLKLDGDQIFVEFDSGRGQRVSVEEADDESLMVRSVVAKPRALREVEDVALRAWVCNRGTRLVGFQLDRRGRLMGHAWVPRQGLTPEEFALYVRVVARECDRLEYLLTGRDVE